MIRDVLIPALEKSFPNRGLRTGEPPDAVAVFPAVHPDVGDVMIYDDGNEATVGIGTITHGHFGWADPKRTQAQIAQSVTDEVVRFLTDLFADRIVLWKSSGGAGGWWMVGHDNTLSIMEADDPTYLWSGPVTNPLQQNGG